MNFSVRREFNLAFFSRWEVEDGLKGGWSAIPAKCRATHIGECCPHFLVDFCLLTVAGLLILRFYFLALFTPFYCCCLQISTLQDLMPGFGQNFPKIPLLKYFSQKDTKNQVVTSLIKIPCMISLAVDRSSFAHMSVCSRHVSHACIRNIVKMPYIK